MAESKSTCVEKLAKSRLEPILCSRVEAAAMLGIGTTKCDELIASGALDSLLLGGRRMVKIASIRALVDGETRQLDEAA